MNIILGTVQFGLDYGINNRVGKPSLEQVFEMLDYASLQGVKILDTAEAYGNAAELLGEYNKSNPGVFLINSKFKKGNFSIREQLNHSLDSLYIQKLNTYFFHSFQDFKKYPELLHELVELKKEKRIIKIGLSVYDNEEFKTSIENTAIDVIQIPFNLLDNFALRGELLQQAEAIGKEIQIRSVFLQGLFFKRLNEMPSQLSKLIPYLQKVNEIANLNNLTIEQLALQYAYSQPEIDHVIIGIDNIEQLKRNLAFTQETLPESITQSINKILVKEIELLYPKNWK